MQSKHTAIPTNTTSNGLMSGARKVSTDWFVLMYTVLSEDGGGDVFQFEQVKVSSHS